MVEDMTVGEAIKRIKEFALHHAIQELPNSARTVEAFEMAIDALEIVSKIVQCEKCRHGIKAHGISDVQDMLDDRYLEWSSSWE